MLLFSFPRLAVISVFTEYMDVNRLMRFSPVEFFLLQFDQVLDLVDEELNVDSFRKINRNLKP